MSELRPLGNTGLLVSPMGLGLAALGRPGYINLGHATDVTEEHDRDAMEARAHLVFDAAWELGIRYFDTARSYGDGERFLASWLTAHHISPGDVTVGSKWGYTYTAGWQVEAEAHEIKDHGPGNFRRQWQESQEVLGTQLDVYHIHSATLESGALDNPELLTALAQKRDLGMVIGLSLSGPKQAETLERALAIEIDGKRLFGCVQATWNVLETSVGPALERAHDAGLGVIVKEGLANGRLTSRNDNPSFASPRAILEANAKRLQTTIDALALAAVINQPWIDVVLSGAATIEQLKSNLSALQIAWDAQATEELTLLVEKPEEYWATRSALNWN